MKEIKLYHAGKDTEELSDTNCQILEEVLTRADAIFFPNFLDH